MNALYMLIGIVLILCFLCLFMMGCIAMVMVFEICRARGRRMNKQEQEQSEQERRKEQEWANLLSYNGTMQGGEID